VLSLDWSATGIQLLDDGTASFVEATEHLLDPIEQRREIA
jgi:hypothetical protein